MPKAQKSLSRLTAACNIINKGLAEYPLYETDHFDLTLVRKPAVVHGSWSGEFFLGCGFDVVVKEKSTDDSFRIAVVRLIDGANGVINAAVTGGDIRPAKRPKVKIAEEFAIWTPTSSWRAEPLMQAVYAEVDFLHLAEEVRLTIKEIAADIRAATNHL